MTNYPVDTVGSFFRYKVRVYNREGSSESSLVTLLNSGPPARPENPPEIVERAADFIRIKMPFIDDSRNGGSPIVSYNLQIDDG